MRWTLSLAAVAAFAVAAGGCGSTITVPDQGIIVTGCQMPSQCYANDCSCKRGDVAARRIDQPTGCVIGTVCSSPLDDSTCNCPTNVIKDFDAGTTYDSVCLETAQACVGRGVFCGGSGARCKPANSVCDGTGDLPMLVPSIGMPSLEPHCQYLDDVCCAGSDGGVTTD
jgi:hypothetical protein